MGGLHLTSSLLWRWTKQKRKKCFGNLSLLLCKTQAIIFYCFVLQHGRLIMSSFYLNCEQPGEIWDCTAIFNERQKVSCGPSCKLLHHCWREIRRIKVIKCPPDYIPWRDLSSNPTNNLNTNADLKVTNSWFMLRLSGTRCDKIEGGYLL